MLAEALAMLIGSAILMLRLGTNSGSFPRPLDAQEERRCVDAWCESGDIEARNKLVEHNLRLVAHIIKKYYTQSADAEDLISIGTVGLIKGVSTYRPDKGVRLATYASKCIENEILMFFRGQKKTSGDLSLSDSIDADGEGNTLSLMDIISEDEDMLERVSRQEISQSLRQHIDGVLSQREACIIKMRYGMSGGLPVTQREVAKHCGISRSYVSRIEKRALEKLRAELERGM